MSSNRDVGAKSVRQWKASDKHGAREWLAERFTALALLPLVAFCFYSAWTLSGGGFDAAIAFLKVPLNAGIIGLTVLIAIWHMNMGLKVIVEDYISKPGTRGFLTFLIFLFSLLLLVAAGGALYLIQGL